MRRRGLCMLAALGMAGLLAGNAQAKYGGHYPVGAEGIKGATLPPPGLYLRTYTLYYAADTLPDGPPNFDLTVGVVAPRLIWMTDKKLAGATVGMDVLVPLIYTDVRAGTYDSDTTGVGDIQLEPLLLAWHGARWDIGAGYALWAPVGDYQLDQPDKPGKGFWSHMLTLGGTWYADSARRLSLSALNRYEIHYEAEDSDITPGDTWTLETGIGYSPKPMWDVGMTAYLQRQMNSDRGTGAADGQDRVYGVGPEISGFCKPLALFASLRYAYEFSAKDRPEGETAVLTLTHRF